MVDEAARPPAQSPAQSPPLVSSPISQAAPLPADQNPEEDDGLVVGAESDASTLRSSILRYREENGRTYHSYKDGAYAVPNDEIENERLDLQHAILLLTFDDKLHCSPYKEPRRVLDAGCGTGAWAIDFADEHLEPEVIGVDLSPIQPAFVPPNVQFFVDDIEDDWTFSEPFDFVFSRMMTGSVKNWPRFFKQSYDNITSGGTIELQDIIYPASCDDGTLTEDCPLRRWSTMLNETFRGNGRPMDSALYYEKQLSDAGFVDVQVIEEKWPTNRWPRDPRYKQLGIWSHENALDGLAAWTLASFTRPKEEGGLGWTREEVEVLLTGVRADLKNTSIHAYVPVWSVYATKP